LLFWVMITLFITELNTFDRLVATNALLRGIYGGASNWQYQVQKPTVFDIQ
jgi:hypothetical protein